MKVFKFIAMFTLTLALGATSLAQTASTSSSESSSDRTPVPRGKYITGGILGSAVGFGIGHGVQGRYADMGWMFTAGEATGILLLLASLNTCTTSVDRYGYETKECGGGLAALGLGTLLGFRIWEVVDVWVGARPVDNDLKVYLLPNPKAPGLGLAYSF